jgi:dGTPase
LAYDAHDVDDALSAGLIFPEDMQDVALWRNAVEAVRGRHGKLAPEQFQPTVVRALIDRQVTDLVQHTVAHFRQHDIRSVECVRRSPGNLVGFGPEVTKQKTELEEFLRKRVYHHYRVQRMAAKGDRIVLALFNEFCRTPQLLPERYQRRVEAAGLARTVCDYVAGMTDRFAQDEYLKLFQPYAPI